MKKLTLSALPLLALLAADARADGHARQRAFAPAYAAPVAAARVHHARSFGFSLYRSRAAFAPAYGYAAPVAAPAYACAPPAPALAAPAPAYQSFQSFQQQSYQQSYALPVQAPAPCYACQQQPAYAAPLAAGGCGVSAGVRLRLGFGY